VFQVLSQQVRYCVILKRVMPYYCNVMIIVLVLANLCTSKYVNGSPALKHVGI